MLSLSFGVIMIKVIKACLLACWIQFKAKTNSFLTKVHKRYTGTVSWNRHTHVKQANWQQRAYVGTALQQTNRDKDCRKIGLKMINKIRLLIAMSVVALLTACGGGGENNNAPPLISAPSSNTAPLANAGRIQNILVTATVTLNGSNSSDANGDALTYSWTLINKPGGSAAVLSNATSAMPTFTADVAGEYVASLVVNDGKVNSTSAIVTVNAAVANAAPVANAGPSQNVTVGATVTLNGSNSSDANGDALTYGWTLTSKPAGSAAVISSATAISPTFFADVAGTYVASLKVNDGKLDSSISNVSVTVTQSKVVGTAYKATNSMSVTLFLFEAVNLGNGYTRYTATYKQQNDTTLAIDEGTLRLYFTNANPQAQYGFFNKVLPGESFALTRSYSWDVLSSSIPALLQYHEDHFFASNPISGSLQWVFPIN